MPKGCLFDQAAFFQSYGMIDWQWSAVNRERVEAIHGPFREAELALSYTCYSSRHTHENRFHQCDDAELRFIANGTVALKVRIGKHCAADPYSSGSSSL